MSSEFHTAVNGHDTLRTLSLQRNPRFRSLRFDSKLQYNPSGQLLIVQRPTKPHYGGRYRLVNGKSTSSAESFGPISTAENCLHVDGDLRAKSRPTDNLLLSRLDHWLTRRSNLKIGRTLLATKVFLAMIPNKGLIGYLRFPGAAAERYNNREAYIRNSSAEYTFRPHSLILDDARLLIKMDGRIRAEAGSEDRRRRKEPTHHCEMLTVRRKFYTLPLKFNT